MKDYIVNRCKQEATYILDTNATIRKTGKAFNVSKSTINEDMKNRLSKINPQLFEKIAAAFAYNKSQRAIRGGKATKLKWRNIKHDRE